MQRMVVFALAAFVLTPVAASAQDGRPGAISGAEGGECRISPERERSLQAAADSLREALECPTDVDWPPLPAEGRSVVRTPEPVRTDVTVPQYAYFYHSPPDAWGGPACLPVIVVQAQGCTFGWLAVLDPPPAAGGSFEHFFDLLGTEPPDGAPPTAESAPAQTPAVAPEVRHVVTGGYWEAGEMVGQYRLVVWNEDREGTHSIHRLQWIVLSPEADAPRVLLSIPIPEVGAPPWISRPEFESRGGASVFLLEQTSAADPSRQRVVEIHPGALGEYRLKLVSERRDL